MVAPGKMGIGMRLRERAEHFGDALILLAQSDDRRDRQAAAHQLLAEFVRPYLAAAKRHTNALSGLDRIVKAESDCRPELIFLPYVRKLITAHRPSNVAWVCPGGPPAECTLEHMPAPSQRSAEDLRISARVLGCA
jgi:hypothetical protein